MQWTIRVVGTLVALSVGCPSKAQDADHRTCQAINRMERSGELRKVSEKVLNEYVCQALVFSADAAKAANREKEEVCDHAVKLMLHEWHVRHPRQLPESVGICAGRTSPKKR